MQTVVLGVVLHKSLGRVAKALLLLKGDTIYGAPHGLAAAEFDLNKTDDVVLPGNNIEFATSAMKIAGHNMPASLLYVLAGQFFCPVSDGLTVAHGRLCALQVGRF